MRSVARLTEAARLLPAAIKDAATTQRKLEDAIPCPRGYVCHLIKGRREPSARIAARIEELIGVPAALWATEPQEARGAA